MRRGRRTIDGHTPARESYEPRKGIMVSRCLEAAEKHAEQGVEATVVDVRSLKPFDSETVLGAVSDTGRDGVDGARLLTDLLDLFQHPDKLLG